MCELLICGLKWLINDPKFFVFYFFYIIVLYFISIVISIFLYDFTLWIIFISEKHKKRCLIC